MIDLLEMPGTKQMLINYYTGKASGTDVKKYFADHIAGMDDFYRNAFNSYLSDLPESYLDDDSIESSNSKLSGIYDFDFDEAPEGLQDRAEIIRWDICRVVISFYQGQKQTV